MIFSTCFPIALCSFIFIHFIVPVKNPIFANSESKALIEQTVRAKDVFIIGDIGNYEQTYKIPLTYSTKEK